MQKSLANILSLENEQLMQEWERFLETLNYDSELHGMEPEECLEAWKTGLGIYLRRACC